MDRSGRHVPLSGLEFLIFIRDIPLLMKEVIQITKEDLTKPRRRWVRKPQTQILPRKKKPSRKKEKQSLKEMLKEGIAD